MANPEDKDQSAVVRDHRGAPVYDEAMWRYSEEPFSTKFKRKFKEYPGIFIGFVGGFGMLSYAIWNYRRRRSMPGMRVKATDMYILQYRVIVQGTVVGCILGSYVYHLVKEKFFDSQHPPDDD